MSADISDCIAMSEDGDWYAFPASLTRGDVIGALADSGDGWYWTLRHFRVRRGYVRLVEHPEEFEWHEECEKIDDGAALAWIADRG